MSAKIWDIVRLYSVGMYASTQRSGFKLQQHTYYGSHDSREPPAAVCEAVLVNMEHENRERVGEQRMQCSVR